MVTKYQGGSKAFRYSVLAKNKVKQLARNGLLGAQRKTIISQGITATSVDGLSPHIRLEAKGKPSYFWYGTPDVLQTTDPQTFYRAQVRLNKQTLQLTYAQDELDNQTSPTLNKVYEQTTSYRVGEIVSYSKGAIILPQKRYAGSAARFVGTIEDAKNNYSPPFVLKIGSIEPFQAPDGIHLTCARVENGVLFGCSVDNLFIRWPIGSEEYSSWSLGTPSDMICDWRFNHYGDKVVGLEFLNSPRRNAVGGTYGEGGIRMDRYITFDIQYNDFDDSYSFPNQSTTVASGTIDLVAVDWSYNEDRDPDGRMYDRLIVAGFVTQHEDSFNGDSPTYEGNAPGDPAPNQKNIHQDLVIFKDGVFLNFFPTMHQDGGVFNGHVLSALPYYVVNWIAEIREMDLRYQIFCFAGRYFDPSNGDSEIGTEIYSLLSSIYGSFAANSAGYSAFPTSGPAPEANNIFRRYTSLFSRTGSLIVNPDMNTEEYVVGFRSYYGDVTSALDIFYNKSFVLFDGHKITWNTAFDTAEEPLYPRYEGPYPTNPGPWSLSFQAEEFVERNGYQGIDGYTYHATKLV